MSAQRQLLQLQKSRDPMATDHDRYHSLSSIVNLDNHQMLASAGALLSFLSRRRLTGENHAQDASLEIEGIEQFNLQVCTNSISLRIGISLCMSMEIH